MSENAVEFVNLTKRYGAFAANEAVSFAVPAGSFHGVVGENGAGKSTLMKMLYGMQPPTSGEIRLWGRAETIHSPRHAIQLGVGMVHQHFHLVGSLPAWKNVVLGEETPILQKDALLSRLSTISAEAGITTPLDVPVEKLGVGERQQVELLKLLHRDSRLLILDEPTAVLTPQEVDKLLERLTRLKAQGKTILFVTHKLREILKFTDGVTVLRQGKVTLNGKTSSLDETTLGEAILGKKRQLPVRPNVKVRDEIALELKEATLLSDDKSRPLLDRISLRLRRGEIVGVAGVEGNGQEEMVHVVTGLLTLTSGDCIVTGKNLKGRLTEGCRVPEVAVIPPDRHREGMVLGFPVWENALLGSQRSPAFRSGPWLDACKARAHAERIIQDYDVRPPDPDRLIGSLSGGNQQKLILGREISLGRNFLVASHPTRGVDIGAMDAIHQRILALKEQGVGVLLLSSELDELLTLSDRIVVLYRGAIQGETTREAATVAQLGMWMMGAGSAATEVKP